MSGKKLAVIGLVIVLILGGGVFGLYTINGNKQAFQGISLPMRGVPEENSERWVEQFEQIMKEEAVLKAIVDGSKYQSAMGLESEEAAIKDLGERFSVKYKARKDSIEIGLTGKRKEVEQMREVAPMIYRVCGNVLAQKDQGFAEYSSSKK